MEEERMNNEVEKKEQPKRKISGGEYVWVVLVCIAKNPIGFINFVGWGLMAIGLLALLFTDGEYVFFCLVIGIILALITFVTSAFTKK